MQVRLAFYYYDYQMTSTYRCAIMRLQNQERSNNYDKKNY